MTQIAKQMEIDPKEEITETCCEVTKGRLEADDRMLIGQAVATRLRAAGAAIDKTRCCVA
ncbi:hypothetical protein ACIQZG_16260 [Lysinibacillus sp. NPDC096418]|uniref:hypothetical protein n=1 Tax=Lysinibacillus sp. NPDC096418 TaxID=3364138 RepID=UPI00381F3346